MTYKVEEIEGIGNAYGVRLAAHDILTTDDLLKKCGTRSGRKKIAEAAGLPESLILTWVNHADLMRIDGIGGQFAELLEASGVDSVKDLAQRNAENLREKMLEVNSKFGLTGKVPAAESIEDMIRQAKKLEPLVYH